MFSKIFHKIAHKIAKHVDHWNYWPFYNFPITKTIQGSTEEYQNIWNKAKAQEFPVVDQYENDVKYAIDRKWLDELALISQTVIKKSEPCYQHGRLLYSTLREYIERNALKTINILETGTALGFSSLCMAKALEDSKCYGKIITFDIVPHNQRMYWNSIKDHEGPLTRSELLSNYKDLIDKYIVYHQGDTKLELKKINIPRIHFAFFDGEHTYARVKREFEYIAPYQGKGDIVFYDDFVDDAYPGLVKAVNEICEEHNYSKNIINVKESRSYAITNKQ